MKAGLERLLTPVTSPVYQSEHCASCNVLQVRMSMCGQTLTQYSLATMLTECRQATCAAGVQQDMQCADASLLLMAHDFCNAEHMHTQQYSTSGTPDIGRHSGPTLTHHTCKCSHATSALLLGRVMMHQHVQPTIDIDIMKQNLFT